MLEFYDWNISTLYPILFSLNPISIFIILIFNTTTQFLMIWGIYFLTMFSYIQYMTEFLPLFFWLTLLSSMVPSKSIQVTPDFIFIIAE